MSKKFKTIMLVGLLIMCTVAVFSTDARAQYSYLGSGWKFNTYEHSMSFKVPGNVVNDGSLFFFSDAVWYDNQVVCKNNGGNISFSPGIGLVSTEGTVNLGLQNGCVNRESGGECTASVSYPNSVAELQADTTLLAACNAAVGETNLTAQQCFLRFYDFDGFISGKTFHCRNKNDTPIEIRTKGVCTTATASTCEGSSCTDQLTQGVRFTFPSFQQNPLDLFAVQLDNSCVACVNGTGPCTP